MPLWVGNLRNIINSVTIVNIVFVRLMTRYIGTLTWCWHHIPTSVLNSPKKAGNAIQAYCVRVRLGAADLSPSSISTVVLLLTCTALLLEDELPPVDSLTLFLGLFEPHEFFLEGDWLCLALTGFLLAPGTGVLLRPFLSPAFSFFSFHVFDFAAPALKLYNNKIDNSDCIINIPEKFRHA